MPTSDVPYWSDFISRELKRSNVINLSGTPAIPAEAVSRAVRRPRFAKSRHGLRIVGGTFRGELDLSRVQLEGPLNFAQCRFLDNIQLYGAQIPQLGIFGSACEGLNLSSAEVLGTLRLDETTFHGPLEALDARIGSMVSLTSCLLLFKGSEASTWDRATVRGTFFASDLRSSSTVRMHSINIKGQLELSDCRIIPPPDSPALILEHAEIDGTIFLKRSFLFGSVGLSNVRTLGDVRLDGATIVAPAGVALNLSGVEANRDVHMDDVQVRGQTLVDDAEIRGNLWMRNAKLWNQGEIAFSCESTDVRGSIFGAHTELHGSLIMSASRIGGSVRFPGLRASASSDTAAIFNDASIRGDLVLKDARLDGDLRAMDVDVKSLNMIGAEVVGSGAIGVALDRAQVRGAVFAGDSRIVGALGFQGAHVANEIGLRSTQIHNMDDAALNVDGASCRAISAGGASFFGAVSLMGAKVAGNVGLVGTRIRSPHPFAIYLDRLTVGGSISAIDLDSNPGVQAQSLCVTSRFNLSGATIQGQDWSLLMEDATLGALFLPDRYDSINLVSADVGNLVTSTDARTKAHPRELAAEGLRLRDVHGRFRTSAGAVSEWLDLSRRFAPQPWWEFAKVYERNGLPVLGRRLRIGAEWRLWRGARGGSRLWRAAYGAVAGWGYLPFLTVLWLVGLLAGCSLLFNAQDGNFVPTNAREAMLVTNQAQLSETNSITTDRGRIPNGNAPCEALNGYQCFSEVGVALGVIAPPGIFFNQAWTVDPVRSPGLWASTCLARLGGWLLSILFVAGVAGLLRRAN